MEQYRKNLGKVVLTCNDYWDKTKNYDILCLVEDKDTNKNYISKKEVPAGVLITNREYWQPIASMGAIDNGIIILNHTDVNGNIPYYDLISAAKSINPKDRRPGLVLGYLNYDSNTDDLPQWKLYQYNDVDLANWLNISSWQALDYNKGFIGWFPTEEELYKEYGYPKYGMYAYVGEVAIASVIYRTDDKNDWINTGEKAFNYIVNFADEEDITNKNNTIKFADKIYNPEKFSGLGRVYLRKNIVDGINVLTQYMVSKPNTIYIIQYDYDLQGTEITIPEGCVLYFQGGSLSNGVINGNNTTISTSLSKIFELDVEFNGVWNVAEVYAEWFGAQKDITGFDSSYAIQAAINFSKNTNTRKIQLLSGRYYISNTINIFSHTHINGTSLPDYSNGTILRFDGNIDCLNLDAEENSSCTNVYIKNICIRTGGSGITGSAIVFNSKKEDEGITNLKLENVDCKYAYCGFKVSLKGFAAFSLCCCSNCTFEQNVYKGVYIQSSGERGAWINHNNYYNCSFLHNGVGGFEIVNDGQIYNNIWNTCQFEGNGNNYNLETYNKEGTFGIYIHNTTTSPTSGNNVITNSYFEHNLPRKQGSDGYNPNEEYSNGTYIYPNNFLTNKNNAAIIAKQVSLKVDNCVSIRTHAFMTVYDNCFITINNLSTPGYALNDSEKFKILVQCCTLYIPSTVIVNGLNPSSLPMVPICGIDCSSENITGKNNIISFSNCADWDDFCIRNNIMTKGTIYLGNTWNNVISPNQQNIVKPYFAVAPTIGNRTWRYIPQITKKSKNSLDIININIYDNEVIGGYPTVDSFDTNEIFSDVRIEGNGYNITLDSGNEYIVLGSKHIYINNLTITCNLQYSPIINLIRDSTVTLRNCCLLSTKSIESIYLLRLGDSCRNVKVKLIDIEVNIPRLLGVDNNSNTTKPYRIIYDINNLITEYTILFNDTRNSGDSTNRPKGLGTEAGFAYYDTDINKFIWWTGDKWVDATGAEV